MRKYYVFQNNMKSAEDGLSQSFSWGLLLQFYGNIKDNNIIIRVRFRTENIIL